MFRGKESSNNRIILISSRVIEFWCFRLPVALGGGGWLGGAPHTCAHACMVNMVISCKWPPPLDLGEIPGIPDDVVHVHMGRVHPLTTPHPQGEGTPGIIQNSIALELIEIFQFCLKI